MPCRFRRASGRRGLCGVVSGGPLAVADCAVSFQAGLWPSLTVRCVSGGPLAVADCAVSFQAGLWP